MNIVQVKLLDIIMCDDIFIYGSSSLKPPLCYSLLGSATVALHLLAPLHKADNTPYSQRSVLFRKILAKYIECYFYPALLQRFDRDCILQQIGTASGHARLFMTGTNFSIEKDYYKSQFLFLVKIYGCVVGMIMSSKYQVLQLFFLF